MDEYLSDPVVRRSCEIMRAAKAVLNDAWIAQRKQFARQFLNYITLLVLLIPLVLLLQVWLIEHVLSRPGPHLGKLVQLVVMGVIVVCSLVSALGMLIKARRLMVAGARRLSDAARTEEPLSWFSTRRTLLQTPESAAAARKNEQLQAEFLAKSDEDKVQFMIGFLNISKEDAAICVEGIKREQELRARAESSDRIQPEGNAAEGIQDGG